MHFLLFGYIYVLCPNKRVATLICLRHLNKKLKMTNNEEYCDVFSVSRY
jgi:hypothetical protein